MTETASNTFEIQAAGASSAQLFEALSTVFNSTAWATATTVAQTWEVAASTANSLTLGLIADGISAGPKIYIENTTSGTLSLLVRYDPDGEIVGGAYSPSASASPLVNFTGANAAPTAASLIYIAQYEDAIMIHFDAGTHFKYMIHAGIVMAPDNASDPDIYIDGSGLIVGQPGVLASSTTSISFISTGVAVNALGHQSYLRIGQTKWGQARLASGDYLAGGVETADVNGRVRLVPLLMRVATNIDGVTGSIGSQSPNVSGELGRTRYLRFYKQNPTHRSVLPSKDSLSQQAWLAWNHGAATATADNVLGLWRKEDPTVVTI